MIILTRAAIVVVVMVWCIFLGAAGFVLLEIILAGGLIP
jgi:hypothetical protein